MKGAQALIRTLADSGVRTCFTNPGTSEMHFVAALDSVPEMRAALGLFEGVVTGAADAASRSLAMSIEASDYLIKPVELQELAAAINRRTAEPRL